MPAVSSEFTSPDSNSGATNSQPSKMTDKKLEQIVAFVYDHLPSERERLQFEALLEPNQEKAKIYQNIVETTGRSLENFQSIIIPLYVVIGVIYIAELAIKSDVSLIDLGQMFLIIYVLVHTTLKGVRMFDDNNVRSHSLAVRRYYTDQEKLK